MSSVEAAQRPFSQTPCADRTFHATLVVYHETDLIQLEMSRKRLLVLMEGKELSKGLKQVRHPYHTPLR